MSLTGRLSTLFLLVLGLVLLGFSLTLYVSAWVYLSRQLRERLNASLAVLAAAAEVHPEGVEWEPQERVLPLGQDQGPQRLRWMVFDPEGNRIDHSRNLVDSELTTDWIPRPGNAKLPARLVDHHGRAWSVAQRLISPGADLGSSSKSAALGRESTESPSIEAFYPSLMLTVCAPLYSLEAPLLALGWFLVALSAAIWLLSAFLCRRLSKRALAPLTKLVASARGLDATDPGWCLEEAGTGDELDDLGRAFNDLLARLHVAFLAQRRFSSDASHQLRTPLTVLIGQIEVALRQERSAEAYRDVLKSALGRASHLAQIVESLLFLARVDALVNLSGGEPVDLSRWVALFLDSRSTSRSEAKVVAYQAAAEDIWVRAHTALLGQLLDNLLDNACKYGTPGTPITVATRMRGEDAILAVENSGPGIAEADLPHIFEPFYRSAQARRKGIPGIGLGLAVVERIATVLGGSITSQSEPGKGARFELRLPLVKPHASTKNDSEGLAITANQCKLRSPFQAGVTVGAQIMA